MHNLSDNTLILGASGFIGSNLGPAFKDCLKPRRAEVDLTDYDEVVYYLNEYRPKKIVNMAAFVAGFLYNKDHNLVQLRKNSLIALNVASAIQELKLDCYYLYISSACVYGKNTNNETNIFDHDPNVNNYGYGWSKRLGHVCLESLNLDNKSNVKSCCLVPTNMFGPHDEFSPKMSHVIPNLIRQMVSGANEITVLGNPHNERDFMYSEDLCNVISSCLSKKITGTFNVSTGSTISISELVHKLVRATNYEGDICMNLERKDKADIRFLENDQLKNALGIDQSFFTDFDEALDKTVSWYKQTLND
tara:strand:- start:17224 stop:18138 length:915 start_codon:yes stop_codon:yes gene_type:complete